MAPALPFVLVIEAYLIGSIPFSFLVVKIIAGADIRSHGSRNVGATNVGRVLGWRLGILVFALDFAKGALPTGAAIVASGQWLAATTRPYSQFAPVGGANRKTICGLYREAMQRDTRNSGRREA